MKLNQGVDPITTDQPVEQVEQVEQVEPITTDQPDDPISKLQNDPDYLSSIDEALGGLGSAILERERVLKEAQDALAAEKNELLMAKEQALARDTSFLDAPELNELAEEAAKVTTEGPNLMDPEGLSKYIEAQVAAKLNTVMQTIVQKQKEEQNKYEYERFKASNPEMKDKDFKAEMVQVIKAYESRGTMLDLQDALDLVKAKRASKARVEVETDRKQRAEAAGVSRTGLTSRADALPIADNIEAVHAQLRKMGMI